MNYKHLLPVIDAEQKKAYAVTFNEILTKANSNWIATAANLTPALIVKPANDSNYDTLFDVDRVYVGLAGDNDTFIGLCGAMNNYESDNRTDAKRNKVSTLLKEQGYKLNPKSVFKGMQKSILCAEDAAEELKFLEDVFKDR
jgi:hypothetical protein